MLEFFWRRCLLCSDLLRSLSGTDVIFFAELHLLFKIMEVGRKLGVKLLCKCETE